MKLAILIITVLMASSCHHKKPQSQRQINNWKQISSWSFTGKMALNDGQQSGSGTLDWFVDKNFSKAKFKAPLWSGSWEITESKTKATLISSQNGESYADNAEILISNELGWEFPWDNLHYWLRGYTPNQKPVKHDPPPTNLIYDGWNISYQKWMQTPIGLLPKKIKATKPPYSVKLIIYSWEIE